MLRERVRKAGWKLLGGHAHEVVGDERHRRIRVRVEGDRFVVEDGEPLLRRGDAVRLGVERGNAVCCEKTAAAIRVCKGVEKSLVHLAIGTHDPLPCRPRLAVGGSVRVSSPGSPRSDGARAVTDTQAETEGRHRGNRALDPLQSKGGMDKLGGFEDTGSHPRRSRARAL